MTDLIPLIKTNLESEEVTAVDARILHEFLEVKTPFKDWIVRRLRDYDFVEGKDFCTFLRESSGGRPAKEYYLSLDMAKHVAMVERNQKGREAREYFITCEKALQNAHYDLIPKTLPEALEAYAKEIRAHQQTQALLEEAKPKVEFYDLAMETESTVDMKQAAKILDLDSLGRNRLLAYLRSKGILDAKNQPYQEYIDKGWFKLVEVPAYNDKEGAFIHVKTVVKQKGLDGVSKLLLKDGFFPRGSREHIRNKDILNE